MAYLEVILSYAIALVALTIAVVAISFGPMFEKRSRRLISVSFVCISLGVLLYAVLERGPSVTFRFALKPAELYLIIIFSIAAIYVWFKEESEDDPSI